MHTEAAHERTAELDPPRDAGAEQRHPLVRVLSIAALAGTAAAAVFVAVTVYRVFTDSWIAPLQLSPDDDRVIQLKLKLNRHLSELARIEAEVERIDAELAAIDRAVERLSTLRGVSRESMTWSASERGGEAEALAAVVANLDRQRATLERLIERQQAFTAEAREHLEGGLIARGELERAEQELDALRLQLVENERQRTEAALRRRQAARADRAFRDHLDASAGVARGGELMPEVAAGHEHDLRLELELVRLDSERRGLEAMRAVAVDRLASERALLEDARSRPLYRALEAKTDIAFVPYAELDGVESGAAVYACTWSLFACERVGRIAEVLPGEVVSQDPWGELARGRYAILDLDDPDAVREKVLRVR